MTGVTNVLGSIWSALTQIDLRGWFTIGLTAMVWRIIEIVASTPDLLDNSSFMQLITPICGAGGILLIATFLFASNKESGDKSKALADNARVMRERGIPVGGQDLETGPVDVKVINPYTDKTDDQLRELLTDRSEPHDDLTREEMLAKLAELDALIPTEPRNG